MVAGNDLLDEINHTDGASWSHGRLSFGHQELVAMELIVEVNVVGIFKSKAARHLYDSSVLSCLLRLKPLIPIWSKNDDHFFSGGRLFGLWHPH